MSCEDSLSSSGCVMLRLFIRMMGEGILLCTIYHHFIAKSDSSY